MSLHPGTGSYNPAGNSDFTRKAEVLALAGLAAGGMLLLMAKPTGAILAVGAGIPTPVVEDGQVVIRNVMSMTLSVDHRVIDGALGAQLLEAIVNHLENPIGMLA